jgi:hypothetical protein
MDINSNFSSSIYSSSGGGLTARTKTQLEDERLQDLAKDGVTVSYSDSMKNSDNTVTIAFRDPKNSGGDKDGMVVINIDAKTFEKLQSKFNNDDFIQNENGVVILNNKAEKYVSKWHHDVAYTRGFKSADKDGNGNIDSNEYKNINAGVDMQFSYNVNGSGQIDNLNGRVTDKYFNLDRLNNIAEFDIVSYVENLDDEKLKAYIKKKYALELKQADRALDYHKGLNSIFNGDRATSIEEAMQKSLDSDKDMDGKLSMDEILEGHSWFEDQDSKGLFGKYANEDYEKNRIDVDFNKWNMLNGQKVLGSEGGATPSIGTGNGVSAFDQLENKGMNPQIVAQIKDKQDSDQLENVKSGTVTMMTLVEKETLIKAIMDNQLESASSDDIKEKQQMHGDLVSNHFDIFQEVYIEAEEEEDEKEEDAKTQREVKESLQDALNEIDDEELKKDVKNHLLTNRDVTSSFNEKVSKYSDLVSQKVAEYIDSGRLDVNDKNDSFFIHKSNTLAIEMVHLDEYLDKKDVSKEDFFDSEDMKKEFIDSIYSRDDRDVSVNDIVSPRNLTKEEWKKELYELNDYYSEQYQKSQSALDLLKKKNFISSDRDSSSIKDDEFANDTDKKEYREEERRQKVYSTLVQVTSDAFGNFAHQSISGYKQELEEKEEAKRKAEEEQRIAQMAKESMGQVQSLLDQYESNQDGFEWELFSAEV